MLEPSTLIYIFAIMIYTKYGLVKLQVETTIKCDCSIRVFECYIREYRSYFQWTGQFLAPPSKSHCKSKGGSVVFSCDDSVPILTHQYAQSNFWLY